MNIAVAVNDVGSCPYRWSTARINLYFKETGKNSLGKTCGLLLDVVVIHRQSAWVCGICCVENAVTDDWSACLCNAVFCEQGVGCAVVIRSASENSRWDNSLVSLCRVILLVSIYGSEVAVCSYEECVSSVGAYDLACVCIHPVNEVSETDSWGSLNGCKEVSGRECFVNSLIYRTLGFELFFIVDVDIWWKINRIFNRCWLEAVITICTGNSVSRSATDCDLLVNDVVVYRIFLVITVLTSLLVLLVINANILKLMRNCVVCCNIYCRFC